MQTGWLIVYNKDIYGNTWEYRYEYEYDDAGNCTEYVCYDKNGRYEYAEYEYDAAGNQAKQIEEVMAKRTAKNSVFFDLFQKRVIC